MAWARELDQARDHVATVVAEVGMGMHDRVHSDGPGMTPDERAYRDRLTAVIVELSDLMFQSAGHELAMMPSKRAGKAMKGIDHRAN